MSTGRTQLKIELDSRDPVSPGSSLNVTLQVITNTPIQIVSGQAWMRSSGRCLRFMVRKGDGQRLRLVTWEKVKNEQYATKALTLLDHGISQLDRVCNFLGPQQESDSNVIKLHEGLPPSVTSFYTARLSVVVPEGIPDSWHCRTDMYSCLVKNTVEALVKVLPLNAAGVVVSTDGDAHALQTLWAREVIHVRNSHVPVEQLERHRAVENRVVRTVGIPWLNRGSIVCRLTARDRLARLGHELPLVVEIDNDSSKTLRKVCLGLHMEIVYTDDEFKVLLPEEVRLLKVRLPSIPPSRHWHREITRFTIPAHSLTSASLLPCSFVSINFIVRLKVKWWFGSSKCDVYIHVGTHNTQRLIFPPTDLEVHEVLM